MTRFESRNKVIHTTESFANFGSQRNGPNFRGQKMDACSQLTLRLVRAAQEGLEPRSAPIDWTFYPELRRATWPEAAQILEEAPKPLLVAALLESGSVTVWNVKTLQERYRTKIERELANQGQYFSQKIAGLGLSESDPIETPYGDFILSVAEFRVWANEYAVPFGVGMIPSPHPNRGRFIVLPAGGHRAPIGHYPSRATVTEACK